MSISQPRTQVRTRTSSLYALKTLLALPIMLALSNIQSLADESIFVHPDWQAAIVAREPQVVDPIAIRFDSKGRLWVVEMRDYPTGPKPGEKPRGQIRILRDLNHDGIYEHAVTFADELLFPTGVQPWRDGAYVTLAGQIVYFNDPDGDDISDERTVCFNGFATGNEQLRANHPRLGPDGLIYVANGLLAGKIQAVDPRFHPRNDPLDLHGSDFCFNPDGGTWDVVAGNSQFGMTIDDYGRRIGCSNRNPAFASLTDRTALARDQTITSRGLTYDVAAAGDLSVLRPRSTAWTTSNLHAGQFSAACGVFAEGVCDKENGREWLLVCEPTGNLIQRQWLDLQGDSWVGTREDQEQEFFASTDTWLRPVDIVAGPNDSIYVADMVRAVIEHPDWVPDEQKHRPDTWDGNDRGRIFRLSPKGQTLPALQDDSINSLTVMLNHSNPWYRELASQSLCESDPFQNSESIRRLILDSHSTDTAKARALHWLAARKLLDVDVFQAMLSCDRPRLVALAISLAPKADWLIPHVERLKVHHDLNVPVSLVEKLSQSDEHSIAEDLDYDQINSVTIETALHIAERAEHNPRASLILGSAPATCLQQLCEMSASDHRVPQTLIAHWFLRWSAINPVNAIQVAAAMSSQPASRKAAVLSAWSTGLNRFKQSDLNSIKKSFDAETWNSLQTFCESLAFDDLSPESARVDAITFLDSLAVPSDASLRILQSTQPLDVRLAAIRWLFKHNPSDICHWLEHDIRNMPHTLRATAIDLLLTNPETKLWLLESVENEKIASELLSPAVTGRLTQDQDQAIAIRSQKVFAPSKNRQELLDRYQALSLQGPHWEQADIKAGRLRFEQSCAACHRIDGIGINVGPDISDTREKNPVAILHSILHPNAAIDAAYYQYSVMKVDGQIVNGLLLDSQPHAVSIRREGGQTVSIPREQIDQMQASTTSLMPDGFERVINEQEMANLIAFLKNWRYLKAQSTIQAK